MLAVDTPEMRVGLMRGLRCGISTTTVVLSGVSGLPDAKNRGVFVIEAPTLANFPVSIFLQSILKKGVCRVFCPCQLFPEQYKF